MKIKSITLSNFRCFGGEVTLNFEGGVTALIGNNGSGKTAIFVALARLFGSGSAQRSFLKSDFHIPAGQTELADGAMLSIDCVFCFPELEDTEQDDSAVPDYFLHMTASGEGEPLKVRMRMEAKWVNDETPEGVIETEFFWVRTLKPEFSKDSDCNKISAGERNFIQLIYVPANRDASAQVTNLLKGRLWRAAHWSGDFKNVTKTNTRNIQEKFTEEAPAKFILKRLQKHWQQLHKADTDRQAQLNLVETEFEALMRRAEFAFYPDEAGQQRSLEDLSDGQKSLFHIALTASILEIERDALAQSEENLFETEKLRRTHLTILAIEEPENSLSPFFLARIMELVTNIGCFDNAQALISSHSAAIIRRVKPEQVRYLRMNEKDRQSSIRAITLPKDATEAGKYVRLAVRAYPDLYFARFVILAEGESEAIILPRLAEAMGFELDSSFVPIVPLGGRYTEHFWKLLNELEIPYATLLDLDLGRKHGGMKLVNTVNAKLVPRLPLLIAEKDLTKKTTFQALRGKNIYFSCPLDVDFSMLRAFPEAYQHPREGGSGPQEGNIEEKKKTVLKTGGNPALYAAAWDDAFKWYPYLFLSESKPQAHLAALARIDNEELKNKAPDGLKALLEKVKSELEL